MQVYNDGLPTVIYDFLCQDNYDANPDPKVISATTILKPVRELLLCQRHDKDIRVPASNRIWSIFGQGIHAVLEGLKGDNIEKEKRLYAKCNGFTISGKFDLIKDNGLVDYKTTSVWTVVYGSRLEEWTKQASIYRWLKWKQDKVVLNETATNVVILRDWTLRDKEKRTKAGRLWFQTYPVAPIIEVKLDLMSFEEVEEMIVKQTTLITESTDKSDADLPKCTDEERWLNKKTGKYNKCDKYCSAAKFCSQVKEEVF